MFQELKFQLSTAILTILTLAAGVAAVINFDEQYQFPPARRRRHLGRSQRLASRRCTFPPTARPRSAGIHPATA